MALNPETPIEEETLPHYEHSRYYPVHVGQLFKARYQVVVKLGYGAYSISWLCQDLLWVVAYSPAWIVDNYQLT